MTDLWPAPDMPPHERMTTRHSDALRAFGRITLFALLLFAAVPLAYWVGRTDERQMFSPICEGSDSVTVAPRYVPRGPVAGARP